MSATSGWRLRGWGMLTHLGASRSWLMAIFTMAGLWLASCPKTSKHFVAGATWRLLLY
jgi:hypothetical protein